MINVSALKAVKTAILFAINDANRVAAEMLPKQKEQWKVSVACFLEQALTNVKEIERKAIAKQKKKL